MINMKKKTAFKSKEKYGLRNIKQSDNLHEIYVKRTKLMTNNDILKKLRVALHLKNDQIVEILNLVDFKITESELTAIFRSEDHPKYVACGDQLLRNFLNGLIIHLRGPMDKPHPKNENH
jgi:uncharacterized protein YehS (DUF1456 family)